MIFWVVVFFWTRFTETDTYMEVFSLHVDIMEPECSIIKLGPKSLKVPEFYSLSDAVDGNVVSFHYERRSSLECSILLSSQDTHLPAHGQLVTGEPEKATKRGDEPESFIHLRQQLGNLWSMADSWWWVNPPSMWLIHKWIGGKNHQFKNNKFDPESKLVKVFVLFFSLSVSSLRIFQ